MIKDNNHILHVGKDTILKKNCKVVVSKNDHTHTRMHYLLMGISIPARSLLRISPSPPVYNQQLSASQVHKQSFVLLHQFFQVSEKEKNRSTGRDFVPLGIRFSFPTGCRVNTTTLAPTLEVVGQEQLSGAHLS